MLSGVSQQIELKKKEYQQAMDSIVDMCLMLKKRSGLEDKERFEFREVDNEAEYSLKLKQLVDE